MENLKRYQKLLSYLGGVGILSSWVFMFVFPQAVTPIISWSLGIWAALIISGQYFKNASN